jgi:predicted nucleic acid-binding protein
VIVVDTGPIVAATFRDDKNHERCVQEFVRLRHAGRPLLAPSFVAGESCYMMWRLCG